jgi:hypothetical protein
MARPLSRRTRRALNSLAYGALVVLVIGLAYLTFAVVRPQHTGSPHDAGPTVPPHGAPAIEVAGFWSRRDKSVGGERLTVSTKLRAMSPNTVSAYVYVLVRNDQVSPRLWAVWPPQGAGGAVSAGGHLRSTDPTTGEAVTLTTRWTRITATLEQPTDRPPFDTALVYVLSPTGDILLVRPFAL